MKAFVLSSAAAAAYALIGFLSGALPRAGGPIAEPNDFAFILLLALCMSVDLLARDRRSTLRPGVPASRPGAALLAMLSRSALVGLVAIAIWGLISGRLRVARLLATAHRRSPSCSSPPTIHPTLIHERLATKGRIADANAAARVAQLVGGREDGVDDPLLGVGPGRSGGDRALPPDR